MLLRLIFCSLLLSLVTHQAVAQSAGNRMAIPGSSGESLVFSYYLDNVVSDDGNPRFVPRSECEFSAEIIASDPTSTNSDSKTVELQAGDSKHIAFKFPDDSSTVQDVGLDIPQKFLVFEERGVVLRGSCRLDFWARLVNRVTGETKTFICPTVAGRRTCIMHFSK